MDELKPAAQLRDPLGETLPPLSDNEAKIEANRCLFCYDAPCTHACPTHIDIPRFIKKIVTDNIVGSAAAIFEANLLGATCARVCPVQELCEGACVLGADYKPIMIGRLQRHTMDHVYDRGMSIVRPGTPTGKEVAIIGAGPAGLSCAGELAKFGHSVTVFEKHKLSGGLSTYGIIALREPVEIAVAEVEMIRGMGVKFENGVELGRNFDFSELQAKFGAIFLGVGLGATPAMGIAGEEYVIDGLKYIEQSKWDRSALKIGREVIVIGAGNTAIDCATIAKRLGAERVTIVYRRSEREMSAYDHEYEFIKKEGVEFQFLTQPVRVVAENGRVTGVECVRMALGNPDTSGRRLPQPVAGSEFVLPADQVVKAIGQEKPWLAGRLGLAMEHGKIKVNAGFETSIPGVYAGGDCIRSQGACSTVMAVEDGKLAAISMHGKLIQQVGSEVNGRSEY